jgi:hypothetical protein
MSGPYTEDFRLPPVGDVLQPWRDLLARPTNDAADGRCPVCKLENCDKWRWARERLAAEGELPDADTQRRDVVESEAREP